MIDAKELDRLDRVVAEKWMGWHRDFRLSRTHAAYWRTQDGVNTGYTIAGGTNSWSPTRKPEHAALARAMADDIELDRVEYRAYCYLAHSGTFDGSGRCELSEVDGNRVLAECVATCRAIDAAVKGREQT